MKIKNILFLTFCSFVIGLIVNQKVFFPKKQKFPDQKANGEILQVKDTYIKPKVLFHGSPNKEIKVFEPRETKTSKNFPDGPLVFASTSIQFASCFMIEWNDSWCHQIRFDLGPTTLVLKDKERFLKADKGGAIYVLPSNNFYTRFYGWDTPEWGSKKEVKPLHKIEFDSAYKAMMELGVQIFFVDEKLFNKIKEPGRIDILMKLEQDGKSANKQQDINPLPLFDYQQYINEKNKK